MISQLIQNCGAKGTETQNLHLLWGASAIHQQTPPSF